MFNDVAAIVMVDKLYILKSPNQLAVVNVGSCVAPVPVTYKQGALSELPPVVPTVNVLVTVVSDRNPPATCAGPAVVPSHFPFAFTVSPVTMAMLNTTVAAVVCVSAI